MAPTKVGLVGASGETGSSILDGLIEAGGFDIIALTRPASMSKPANITIKDRGVELRPLDLTSSHETIVAALKGVEVLISAVGPTDQLDQIPLATAAQAAGVKLFLPCAFVTVIPIGIHNIRDEKEAVYNHMKRLGLPYTIVDVGWWYQISFPALPSGKIDYAVANPNQKLPGDGNQPNALTDLRDIGRYIAKIVKDERTINKYVLVFNEMCVKQRAEFFKYLEQVPILVLTSLRWSPNQIYDLVERLSGEKLDRSYESRETLEQRIRDAEAKMANNPELQTDFATRVMIVSSQYLISWGIRGDNTPEYAKYLGYLTSKELYPDMEYTKYEDYLSEVLSGGAKGVYEKYKAIFANFKESQGK